MRAKFVNINEEFIGMFRTHWHYGHNEPVEVYKNPQSLKRLQPWIRGCSDKDGNLYVADSQDILHHDLATFLVSKGIKDDFVDWQRHGKNNTFYLAEGYDLNGRGLQEELTDEQVERINTYTPKVAETHPMYKFIQDTTILNAINQI